MKKILIVGDGKSPTINKNFINYFSENNNYIFDILSFKVIESSKFNKIYSIPKVINNKFYRFNSLRFLFSFVLKGIRIIRKYDIVHFHMFYPGIFFLTPFFKQNVVLTLWGSDFLKSSKFKKKLLWYTLKRVKVVTCTNQALQKKIVEYYPFISNKIKVFPYMLKYIELVNSSYSYRTRSKKIRIVVGTNSNLSQNHLEILSEIKKSDLDKNNLHVIIPLSYGRGSKDYKLKISNLVKSISCTYQMITKKLNNQEITDLRLNCDILINLQDTDQLSGAMLETLCADNIVITGSWLDYNVLKSSGIFFYEINKISDLANLLNSINLDKKPKNREIIVRDYLPQNVKQKWVEVYENI